MQNLTDADSGSGNGMVVAGKPEAAEAGSEILRAGGNATDAAVSALLVLFRDRKVTISRVR